MRFVTIVDLPSLGEANILFSEYGQKAKRIGAGTVLLVQMKNPDLGDFHEAI